MGNEVVINGRFLTNPLTGVQRYALEVTRRLPNTFQSRYDGNNDHVYRSEVGEFREVHAACGELPSQWREQAPVIESTGTVRRGEVSQGARAGE